MRELRAQFPPPLGGARAAAAVAGKREPYPPARLWYRVSVEFKGSKVFTDRVSGLPEPEVANWKLESRHAVRLTLLCTNVKSFPRPFWVTERIRGTKRRVGGCPRPTKEKPRKNLRDTVQFAATATGEVTRWQLDDPIDFGAGCPGRVTHQELVEHHPLTGTISSPSSATAGLTVFADPRAGLADARAVDAERAARCARGRCGAARRVRPNWCRGRRTPLGQRAGLGSHRTGTLVALNDVR